MEEFDIACNLGATACLPRPLRYARNEPPPRYDFRMDYKDISERIALLTREIRDLQHSEDNHRRDRASHDQRELRLRQIKAELSRMMSKPTQREKSWPIV